MDTKREEYMALDTVIIRASPQPKPKQQPYYTPCKGQTTEHPHLA